MREPVQREGRHSRVTIRLNMSPPLRHRICARPTAISWVLGTLMLWIPVTVSLFRSGAFPTVFTGIMPFLFFLLCYGCMAGLGLVAGLITTSWLVLRVCRRVNGAPFAVGDWATILVGPRAGTTAQV